MASDIETSIRGFLAQGDSRDPDFRLRVYEAADRAIERLAEKNGNEAEAKAKRADLVQAIEAIEAEYGHDVHDEPAEAKDPGEPAQGGSRKVAPPVRASEDAPRSASGGDPVLSEMISSEDRIDIGGTNGADEPGDEDAREADVSGLSSTWRPGGERSGIRRKRPWGGGILVSGLILLLILFLLAAGLWLLLPLVSSAFSPPQTAEGPTIEETIAAAERGEGWISVFDGTQLDAITSSDGGRVVADTALDGSPVVRITGGPEAGSEIALVVGPGVVSRLKGENARAELTAGTDPDASREFSVRCLFDGETHCGRQRFTVSTERQPFVFEVDLTGINGGDGRIAIDPSLGQGNDLIVYSLRLKPAEGV